MFDLGYRMAVGQKVERNKASSNTVYFPLDRFIYDSIGEFWCKNWVDKARSFFFFFAFFFGIDNDTTINPTSYQINHHFY